MPMLKKRSSKQLLAETLLALSESIPVDKITVKQIVEESGLSLQTFYNHFKDKYELILWIHKSEGDKMLSKLGSNEYSYHDLVMENIRFYVEHKDFMRNALNNTHGMDSYAEQSAQNAYHVWYEYICKAHGLEKLPQEIDFDLKLYCYASVRMMAEWAFNMDDISPEAFAAYMFDAMPLKLRPFLEKS